MLEFSDVWDIIGGLDLSLFNPKGLLDFLIVFVIVYQLLKLVRGTRAVPMAIGIAVLGLLYQAARWLELDSLQTILRITWC